MFRSSDSNLYLVHDDLNPGLTTPSTYLAIAIVQYGCEVRYDKWESDLTSSIVSQPLN